LCASSLFDGHVFKNVCSKQNIFENRVFEMSYILKITNFKDLKTKLILIGSRIWFDKSHIKIDFSCMNFKWNLLENVYYLKKNIIIFINCEFS
jgi:hypothetical protein